jgi:type IV secretion system protein VirD4
MQETRIKQKTLILIALISGVFKLKALFKDTWESIVGNCDEFLYLGGNEQSTHKYVSELLGKETIDTNTYGLSKGRNGSYSTNYQLSGRELLTPDEVRMLDNRYSLLFIRGECAVIDEKYDILKHPNLKLTVDGGSGHYLHGGTENAVDWKAITLNGESDYELLSEEELEAMI